MSTKKQDFEEEQEKDQLREGSLIFIIELEHKFPGFYTSEGVEVPLIGDFRSSLPILPSQNPGNLKKTKIAVTRKNKTFCLGKWLS